MRLVRWVSAFVLLLGVVASLTEAPDSSSHDVAAHVRSEAARLRDHFDAVDAELRARDVSHLTSVQRVRRSTLITWLREYRDAAVFPLNTRVGDRAIPIFRDDRGVLCAMAYLIDRSGRSDVVDRVARTSNYAYIPELSGDSALVQWLDDAGLTLAEAARIQPQYPCGGGFSCPAPPPPAPAAPLSRGYTILSAVTGGAALTTVGLNLTSPSRDRGWAGVFAGSVEALTGVSHLNREDPATRRLATASTIAGGLAIVAGGRAIWAARSKSRTPSSDGRRLTVDLTVFGPFDPATRGRGLGMRITF